MDLNLYAGVVRRFWRLFVAGVLLAFALAFLSFFRVSSEGIGYRTSEVWQSQSLLLLTQPGFPYGRTVFPSTPAQPAPDPSRLQSLTELYAQLAGSDAVRGDAPGGGPQDVEDCRCPDRTTRVAPAGDDFEQYAPDHRAVR